MKRFSLLHTFLLLTIISFGQAPPFRWAKSMGGATSDWAHAITTDTLGNIYSTGYFYGTSDFDPGPGIYNLTAGSFNNMYISKLDANGNFVWAKNIGGMGLATAVGFGIAINDSGSIFLTGAFRRTVDFDPNSGVYNLTASGTNENVFVSKYDTSGNFIWVKNFAGFSSQSSRAYSISLDGAGNIYTTGGYWGKVDFDPGPTTFYYTSDTGGYDIFVSKLDPFGNFVWAKSIGGNSDDFGNSIKADVIGNISFTGSFKDNVDFDSDSLAIANLSSNGLEDIFICQLDFAGNFVWAKNIGGAFSDIGNSIAIDSFDNLVLTGFFMDTVDFDPSIGIDTLVAVGNKEIFVLKLDMIGNYVWANGIGGTSEDIGWSIAIDSMNNIYTTGTFSGVADFDSGVGVNNLSSFGSSDIFISKFDELGNFGWAKNIGGGTANNVGYCITVDNLGNIFTIGYFSGTADFNTDSGVVNITANPGSVDIFIHKMGFSTVGIQEHNSNNNSLSLFPNPTSNSITIVTSKPANISIVNLLGQELFNSKIEKSQAIDVSFLSNGIYFVKDLQNGGSVKFIKQ